MNNPMELMNFIKGIKNPKEAVMKMVKSNSNPMLKNLIDMAERGDSAGIESFAKNIYKEQGKDFDKEFSEFINKFK